MLCVVAAVSQAFYADGMSKCGWRLKICTVVVAVVAIAKENEIDWQYTEKFGIDSGQVSCVEMSKTRRSRQTWEIPSLHEISHIINNMASGGHRCCRRQ